MEKDREKVVLLDGAVGTSLWEKTENKVAVWRYNAENPDIVRELNREYTEAGAQIVLANTFGANRIAMRNTGYEVRDIMARGIRLAREGVDGKAQVALSVGPLPVLLEPYGDLSDEEAYEIFDEQISGGAAEKPDVILLETFMDIRMMEIAVKASMKHDLPIFAMMSFQEVGKTMMGNSVADFVAQMQGLPVSAVGLNCSLGPEKAIPVISQFRQYTDLPLAFKPNAGKPILSDAGTTAEYDTDTFVRDCLPALSCGVKYLGGCCGSNPAYIRALRAELSGRGLL